MLDGSPAVGYKQGGFECSPEHRESLGLTPASPAAAVRLRGEPRAPRRPPCACRCFGELRGLHSHPAGKRVCGDRALGFRGRCREPDGHAEAGLSVSRSRMLAGTPAAATAVRPADHLAHPDRRYRAPRLRAQPASCLARRTGRIPPSRRDSRSRLPPTPRLSLSSDGPSARFVPQYRVPSAPQSFSFLSPKRPSERQRSGLPARLPVASALVGSGAWLRPRGRSAASVIHPSGSLRSCRANAPASR